MGMTVRFSKANPDEIHSSRSSACGVSSACNTNASSEIVTHVLTNFPPPSTSSPSSSAPTETSPSPAPTHPASHFINHPNTSKSTALHWAALNGHLHITRTLADSGADLTLENAAKHDALDEAERAGKKDVVRFLMARLSGKTEEEVDRIEEEAKRIEREEEEKERAGDQGVAATQGDLERLGLEEGNGEENEGGVKV